MRRAQIAQVVESRWFSNAMLVVILINAAILGWATYEGSAQPYLVLVERVVVVIFVVELTLKLIAWRGGFFRDPWNWFDFFVVVISVIPATGPFSVLRIMRVLRVLRVITAVPQMRTIISALFRAVPGMGTVIGLLLVVIYTAAILGQQLFGEDVPQYFGDLGTSLYTLFTVMTTENWPDFADAVAEEHPMGWMFFVGYIVLTTFIILNLVIGVIVTSMEQEVDSRWWVEDQELEAVQHEAVMAKLTELSEQVARLDRMVRDHGGDPDTAEPVGQGAAAHDPAHPCNGNGHGNGSGTG